MRGVSRCPLQPGMYDYWCKRLRENCDANRNLSFWGLGVEIDGVPPITDISVAVTKMLEKIKSKKKKVLITIDEAVCNQTMQTLTFLYRAPKMELKPLNIGMIATKYQNMFTKNYGGELSAPRPMEK